MNVKKRTQIKSLKKTLIFGDSKAGKSTFAEQYCNENGLHAIVLDIEDTNYTNQDLINDFDLSSDMKIYRQLKKLLKEIENTNYDTIVVDGVDSLIEAFISDANGLKAYADRSKTFSKFLRDLEKTGKNLIFIGQSPINLEMYRNTDENPNKCIIRLNARCNEVYECIKTDKGEYIVNTISKRGVSNE